MGSLTAVGLIVITLLHFLSALENGIVQRKRNEVEAAISAGNETLFEDALQNILVERVVGTENHARVAQFIKSTLTNLGWHVSTDTFESSTPRGVKRFENIIAQLNPRSSRAVALACHYDSKYFEDFTFLAATDSAVPCAMMINLAQTLQNPLKKLEDADFSLDLIFFDGEEALHEWTATDSLYGSRHLAAKMEKDKTINRLGLLILLDLLGAEHPRIPSHFSNTDDEHRLLVQIEKKLRATRKNLGRTLFSDGKPQRYFQDVPSRASYREFITIEDDHVPFWYRGVRVLHMIPAPFPPVWHREEDNRSALDMGTIHDLNVILRAFILRYFGL